MSTQQEKKKSPLPTRLRELVANGKWTQKEIASAVGVKPQSISQYLDGTVNPSYSVLIGLADLFGVSTDYLLGRTSIKTSDMILSGAAEHLGLSQRAISTLQSNKTVQNVTNHMLCGDFIVSFANRAAFIHDANLIMLNRNIKKSIIIDLKKMINQKFRELSGLLGVIFEETCNLSSQPLSTEAIQLPEDRTQVLLDQYQQYKMEIEQAIFKNNDEDPQIVESAKKIVETLGYLIDQLSEG